MTKNEEEKKLKEAKKKQRLMKMTNGANYSNRLIRTFNNMKNRENKVEIEALRSANNTRKHLMNTTSEFSRTKMFDISKNTRKNQDEKDLNFVPFLQERDGMGKLISQDKDDIRRVKIIRLDTKANHRNKDFSNSLDLKNSLTHLVYEGSIDIKSVKENGLDINAMSSANNSRIDSIDYSKFEIKKKFEPFFKPYNTTTNQFYQDKNAIRSSKTPKEENRLKGQTPCLGSYDYSYDMISKRITRNFIFPNEHPDYRAQKNLSDTMMNLSDIYQKIETHKKLVDDFGKQIARSQSLLKWAPAIHETEKLKVKKKEQEFKEIDSKDLEREYHFNRYLQKKYNIRNYVPPLTQDIKKSLPYSKDDFKEKTIKIIQKYDFKSSLPEFKKILKVQIL